MFMKWIIHRKRKFAALFLLIQVLQLSTPAVSWALTSGPAQPESKGFQAAGTSDMVDLFTGDFKYNIPLLDVDGYPVNLNYQSGTGMEDEASWVGLGWNLNVGSITRQVRGIADDAMGDKVVTEHYTKPKITVGGRIDVKGEIKGIGLNKLLSINGGYTLGIFSDNYTGIGAEIGANAGLSTSFVNGGELTGTLGVGVLSNTQNGVDVRPSFSLSLRDKINNNSTVDPRFSASLGYNTRGGLKGLTLGASFSVNYSDERGSSSASYDIGGSNISYNTPPIIPKVQIPYKSRYGSFSIDAGGAAFLGFLGAGGTGYRNIREVKSRFITTPSYGFLYADKGKNVANALSDFIREKEAAIVPELPNLALPIHTPDLFTYTNQLSSGQFRLYRSTGIFADNQAEDENTNETLGADFGVGAYVHAGVSKFDEHITNVSRKWTKENSYLSSGDFQSQQTGNVQKDAAYFRQVGEKNIEDEALNAQINYAQTAAVSTSGRTAANSLRFASGSLQLGAPIETVSKSPKRTSIQHLTASEASKYGLETKIKSYRFNNAGDFTLPACHAPVVEQALPRVDEHKLAHHISQIDVTSDAGYRMVYGIPVYNLRQDEYSYAVGDPSGWQSSFDNVNHQVAVDMYDNTDQINHKKGVDHYFHKESVPPYANAYLLSAMLSPDYQDKTGDGITPDDNGTAVKFDYSRLPYAYKWRTPYNNATLNRSNLADPDDDKASFVYGEKEVWYLNAIETKTKIAYFITEDRKDALGVLNWNGKAGETNADETNKLKLLREIRLYSKSDLTKPIKTVHFDYSYELCRNIPNFSPSAAGDYPKKGKLTLKQVYFQYANIKKSNPYPYKFHYESNRDDNGNDNNEQEIDYSSFSTDRWGVYRNRADIPAYSNLALENDEFPYSAQATAGPVAPWHLNKIELPSGGTIRVEYEPDDYAFVQNKQAMVMMPIAGFVDATNNPVTSLKLAKGIKIPVTGYSGSGSATNWFKKNYLNGSDYIYSKTFVNLSNRPLVTASSDKSLYDFVPCYSKISSVTISGNTAYVYFESITDHSNPVNPIIMAAWQRMRNDYPRYAYPGYDNRVKDGDIAKSLKAAVSAIVDAAGNLAEIKESFNSKAYRKNFATVYDPSRSFVRVVKKDGFKKGGGFRVHKISVQDNWQALTQNQNALNSETGQVYEYTTQYNNQTISSGVASYEPSVGGDENPLRQPIPYTQRIKGGIDNYFSFEEPYAESLFPAPGVGYSKVTVKSITVSGQPDPGNKTGTIVNEFYTAKDFPVFVEALPLQRYQSGPSGSYSLFGSSAIYELTLSQGYSIELNDMHGKPKAVKNLNQSGDRISSIEYFYNSKPAGLGEFRLNNSVSVANQQGNILNDKILGREIEFFSDMREQETNTVGKAINIGFDMFPAPFFGVPIALPHFPVKNNDEYKLFRSSSSLKVVQQYGILNKVVKTESGSTSVTENTVYDMLTGEPVVTRTNNEFDRDVYSVTLPSYWVYSGMSGAYKNAGSLLKDISIGQNGVLLNYTSFLHEGDELVDIYSRNRYWVVYSADDAQGMNLQKRLTDRSGNTLGQSVIPLCKIIRSGYRNVLTPVAGSFSLLTNPVKNGKLFFTTPDADLTLSKVISLAATTFDENWGMPGGCPTCPANYHLENGECVQDLVENTAYCFQYCSSTPDPAYSAEGTILHRTASSPGVILKSGFWGGSCPVSAMNVMKENGMGEQVKPVAKLRSYDSSSAKYAGRGISSITSLSPGQCARTDYGDPAVPSGQCGGLIRSGIWLCTGLDQGQNALPVKEWFGFDTCISFPASKTYYFGFAADNRIRIYLDGRLVRSLEEILVNSFSYWHVWPVDVKAGKHDLKVEFNNESGPAMAGMEIYNKSYTELLNAVDASSAGIIFSTAGLRGHSPRFSYLTGNGGQVVHRFSRPDSSAPDICDQHIGSSQVMNPYVTGFKGNWMPYQNYVYQSLRTDNDAFNASKRGLDIANSGYINDVFSFWKYNLLWSDNNSHHDKWIAASTVTLADRYGHQLEEKNALGIYGAALYTFNGELTSAVASNARNREIFFNSFEDVGPGLGCYPANPCPENGFTSSNGNMSSLVTNAKAHSGNYSLHLGNGTISLAAAAHTNDHKTLPYVANNTSGAFMYKQVTGLYPKGFEPYPGTKYVFNAWVKDNQPSSLSVPCTLNVNGSNISLTCKAIVEGWKQVEGLIDLASLQPAAGSVTISLSGTSDIYVDDVRIFPFQAQMKSYAYDNRTFRLMAEMDENNFASFYEYDHEGILARVKKETSRGIMTLKESRSAYKSQ